MIVENKITIDAPIEKVWDALINPELTTQYMYGCVPLTDWKIGPSKNGAFRILQDALPCANGEGRFFALANPQCRL